DAEGDDVDARRLALGHLPVDLGEQVRGDGVDAACGAHGLGSLLAWRSGMDGRSELAAYRQRRGGAGALGRIGAAAWRGCSGSADPQLAVADLGQGALGAPALGPVDEFDDLPALDLGDGVAPGHGLL